MCIRDRRQTLFGNTDPTGEQVRLKSMSCEVIGLLEAKGASSIGTDQDDLILISIRTLQRAEFVRQKIGSVNPGFAKRSVAKGYGCLLYTSRCV